MSAFEMQAKRSDALQQVQHRTILVGRNLKVEGQVGQNRSTFNCHSAGVPQITETSTDPQDNSIVPGAMVMTQ